MLHGCRVHPSGTGIYSDRSSDETQVHACWHWYGIVPVQVGVYNRYITGSLLGWGRGQAQPAATHPIHALLTLHNDLFVLTSTALQHWQGSTLLSEFNLQQAVETVLTEETLRESFDTEERVSHKCVVARFFFFCCVLLTIVYRVWLLQLAPGVPKESVHVLVARYLSFVTFTLVQEFG